MRYVIELTWEEIDMLIETKRLIIRDLKEEDGSCFAVMAKDGSLQDCGLDRNFSKWMEEWMAEAQKFADRDDPNRDYLVYTVCLKDSGIVVGTVGCSFYEDLQETGITYFVGAQYRRNGFAAEALHAYIRYFFDHYNVQKMIATIREENVPSWKTIEKTGFKLTEKRMYKDINDAEEVLYRFYEIGNKQSGRYSQI